MDNIRKDPIMDLSQAYNDSLINFGNDEAFGEQYKHLIAENNELKNQFLRLSEQKDNSNLIQTENIQLKAQITQYQSQIKELDERFQISLQINNDLKKEYECKLLNESKIFSDKIEALKEQIEKANLTIENLQKQANKQKNDFSVEQENIKSENMVLKRQKNNFLNQLSILFDYNFTDYNNIISYITNIETKPHQIEQIENSQKEQLHIIKNKYEKERQKYKSLKLKLKVLLQEYDSDKFSLNNTISGLTSKILALENELSRLEIEHRAEIEMVRSKKLSRFPEIKIQSSPMDEEPQESELMKNATKALKEAHGRIREQNNQIEALKAQNRQQLSEIKQKERDIEKLSSKINNEFSSVQTPYQSVIDTKAPVKEKEIESMKLQLTTAAASNIQAESAFKAIQQDLEIAKQTLENNKSILDQQYNEISKLYSERSHLIELLQMQNTALSRYERMSRQVEKIYVSPDNQGKGQKVENELNFDFSEAPEEIRDALDRVAGNTQISIQMRLKGAIKVIAKWASSISTKQDNSISSLTQKVENLEIEKCRLHQSICTILQQNICLNNIPEIVNQMLTENNNLKSETEHLKTQINEICEQLRIDDITSIADIFGELTQANKEKKKCIDEYDAKLSDVLRENRTLKKLIPKLEKRMALDQSKYREALNKSINVQEENQKEIDSLQSLNNNLVQQISKLNREKEEMVAEIQKQFEDELSHINSNSDINKLQNKSEISKLRAELDSRDVEIENMKAEISQWKAAAQECTKEIGKLRSQLSEAEEERDKTVQAVKEQHFQSLQSKESEFEAAIEAMKEHSRTDSLLIEKTTSALRNSEGRCKALQQTNQRLSCAVDQLESRLRSAQESAERERQIEGAKAKAGLIAAEMRCNAECENQRQQYETHTRQLYSAVMASFSAFCDGGCSLSEQSFFKVLERVKSELERLSKQDQSIRSITRAKEGISTEDAVSELYLSSLHFSQQ